MDNTPLLPADDPTLTESNSTPRSDNSIARITTRQQPERYLFSAEITILYRKERAYKDKYFIIAYFRDYATKSQLRKNTSGLGTRISDFFRSPSMSVDNDIIPFWRA